MKNHDKDTFEVGFYWDGELPFFDKTAYERGDLSPYFELPLFMNWPLKDQLSSGFPDMFKPKSSVEATKIWKSKPHQWIENTRAEKSREEWFIKMAYECNKK